MSVTINFRNPTTVWQVPEAFRQVYTHATEVSSGSKTLYISGQLGVRTDGTLPEGFSEQATQAMQNVEALLAASDMGPRNLVKLSYFLTRSTDAPELVKLRAAKWGDTQPPAVTVLTVSALARPEYLIEIEAVAVS